MKSVTQQLWQLKKPDSSTMFLKCQAGHRKHMTKDVSVLLEGKLPLRDLPPIPKRLTTTFHMYIYDWAEYFKTVGTNETVPKFTAPDGKTLYCPGQDIISYCIDRQGIWEGHETLLMLDILSQDNRDLFIDFGAHIGWYSLIAALWNHPVVAVDTSDENIGLLESSAMDNGLKITTILGQIDEDAKTIGATDENIQLLKCDIEGYEPEAYAMTRKLFKAKKIKYAIFEISPVFNDRYPELVEDICSHGYSVYQIPSKSFEHQEMFAASPLAVTIDKCQLFRKGRREYIAGLHQENFLFVRNGGSNVY